MGDLDKKKQAKWKKYLWYFGAINFVMGICSAVIIEFSLDPSSNESWKEAGDAGSFLKIS